MVTKSLFLVALSGFAFLICSSFEQASANEFGVRPQEDQGSVLAAYRSGIGTHADFKRVSKFVKNSSDTKWREISWIPGLWDGVKASQAKNKPMFIWAMNGDPLGCV